MGRDATLTCVINNLGNYKVAWVRVDTQTILTIDDAVITRNPRIGVRHTADANLQKSHSINLAHIHHIRKTWQLLIRDVHTSDAGAYMCQLNTEPMTSQTAYLTVTVPPDIIDNESSGDVMVTEGSNTTLRCIATGYPPPIITWRREDNKPINNHAQTVEGPILYLTRIHRQNIGAYLCIASNGVPPSVSKRFMLRVQFSPSIVATNQLVGARHGDNVTLECHCESFPKPVVYWLRHTTGEVVVSGGKYRESKQETNHYKLSMQLTFLHLDNEDFMPYQCVCRNTLGVAESVVRLYQIHPISAKKYGTENDVLIFEDGTAKANSNLVTLEASNMKSQDSARKYVKSSLTPLPIPKPVSNGIHSVIHSSFIQYMIVHLFIHLR